ncbi:hypothetical protein PSEUDO8AS_80012 [Pseudomonas sp. 8AS]|uniref:hypothetical protein n=1 Tax=Pseudomonas sp. 8AS TaxID=2653163 RepID=UPI0012F13FC0|nr:hypothetical protein [Pseudomonas sp. 8AS]VXC43101.1 hypothetical protein PSEUDO8AS_80012 [Pseudomonas sp. 8AS]
MLGFAALNANLPRRAAKCWAREITLTPDKQVTQANSTPGYALQRPFKNKRMLCYAISASDDLLRNDSATY